VTPVPERHEIGSLIAGAKTIGVELDEDAASLLISFLDRFYSWNRFGGFTRIPRDQGLRLHLLESLTVVGDLRGAKTVVDLGTGGGMPGIPLAIVVGGTDFTLVEARGRRCTFLREIIRDYGLAGRVEIVEGDAWDLARGTKRFDGVLARAFLPPKDLLILGSRLITRTGRVLVMGSNEEWIQTVSPSGLFEETGLELRSQRTLILPCGGEARRIFRFERPASDCFT
jgi:16S rRNA (guanine527-N7)-methyltransferase